jgi:hypothetical protein
VVVYRLVAAGAAWHAQAGGRAGVRRVPPALLF